MHLQHNDEQQQSQQQQLQHNQQIEKYRVREATVSDITAIRNCNLATLPENYNDNFYKQFIAEFPRLCLVAVVSIDDKDHIVGYTLGRLESLVDNNGKKHGHVSSIAVYSAYRGMGIAHSLMNSLHRSFYCNHNIDMITLHVRASNAGAINLYTKTFPYMFAKKIRQYYDDGEDAWLMQVNDLAMVIDTATADDSAATTAGADVKMIDSLKM